MTDDVPAGGGSDGGGSDAVLARLDPAPGRRVASVGMHGVLGTLMLAVVLARPPADPGWLAFLAGAGLAALWLAWRQWRATAVGLVLTRQALRDGSGTVLALMHEIEAMDRGLFAYRPANGFVLRLSVRRGRGWAPGLWWRAGRRVGVGGVTPGAETRALADLIAVILAERGR